MTILDETKYWSQPEFISDLLKQLPLHVFWKDINSVYLGCNETFAEGLGLSSPKEIIGKSDYDLCTTKEESDIYRADDRKIISSRHPKLNFEEKQTLPNGKVITLLTNKVPLFDKFNNLVGILGVYSDITAQKEAERLKFEKIESLKYQQLLKEQKEHFENILAKMPGHVYWKDKNGIFLGCNDQQAKSLNLASAKDVVGKSTYEMVTDILPENERRQHAELINAADKKVMDSKKELVFEEPMTKPDGTEVCFISTKSPLYDHENNVIGILGISFDITKEKHAERLIQESLKQQVALSEHIAAVVAHEVRTPLASIQAGTTAIKDCIAAGELDEITEICEDIRTQLKKVGNFIDTFLKNVKNEALYVSEMHMIKTAIDLALKEYPFTGSEQRALVRLDANLENFAYAGEEQLIVHVLFNLIKNALYFIAKAEKGHLEIFSSDDAQNYYLHIKDYATGIAKEDLPFIFDRFYTKTGVGSGIGLSYCKMTMNAINGDIICCSELDQYAEFILRFPKVKFGSEY